MVSITVHPKYRGAGKHRRLINYYAVCYDPERRPKRIWRTLRTKDRRVALQRAAQLEHDIAHKLKDPWTDRQRDGHLALADAVEIYQDDCERVDRPKSQAIKQSRYDRFVAHFPETTSVKEITAEQITAFLDSLTGRDGKTQAAPNTVAAYFNSLFGFFSWLLREGYVQRHPMRGTPRSAGVAPPRVPEGGFNVLVPGEIETIKKTIIKDCEAMYAKRKRRYLVDVVDLVATTGIRVAEAVSLNWGQVVLSAPAGIGTARITVRNYFGGRSGQRFLTKSGKARTIPVFPRGAAALHRMRDRFTELHGREPIGDDPVILGAWGSRALDQSLTKLFTEYVVLSAIGKDATLHDLRHTYISWIVNELQIPVPVAQKLAGHADVARTIAYVHVSEQTVVESMTRALRSAGIEAVPPAQNTGFAQVARWLAGYEPDAKEAAPEAVLQMFYTAGLELAEHGGN